MQDTQNFPDQRMVKIAKVGIKNVSHPIFFSDSNTENGNVTLPSTAIFSFFVELPSTKKGTHMSRFPTLLYDFAPYFSLKKLEEMAHEINKRLESKVAFVETDFTYFHEKFAPVSKTRGLANIQIKINVKAKENKQTETILSIKIPVKSLCPCSKAISNMVPIVNGAI